MNFESSKILGGIGAILMFISILPYISTYTFGALGFIGAIMVLVGLYGLSGYYREPGIFKNALYGIVVAIIGVIIVAVLAITVVFAALSPFLYEIFPGWDGTWTSLQGMTPNIDAFTSGNFDYSSLYSLAFGVVGILAIAWIVFIISIFFVRRSLKMVTTKSTIGLFGTAGLLMLVGAFLTIIVIGVILIWIGVLLLAIAFFQLKPVPVMTSPSPPAPV